MLSKDYGKFWLVELDEESGVLTCTMNRPERKNAMIGGCLQEFSRLADDVAEDPRIKAVILTGAGRAFSTGGDIDDFHEKNNVPAIATSEAFHRTWHRIIDMPQPLIVAINGDCVGAGITLALCGDILLCADHARIGDPHVPLGMVASGGNCLWSVAVGLLHAKRWLLTGDLMPAAEAHRIGLVNHLYPAATLMDEARALATRIGKQPPEATRWNKRVLNRIAADRLNMLHDAGLAYEALSSAAPSARKALADRVEYLKSRKRDGRA